MGSLNGKLALVTGGSRGIGAEVALSLAGAGADVVVNFKTRAEDAERVCAAIRKLGRRALDLGFTSTVGIIHDHAGQLKPIADRERDVFLAMKGFEKKNFSLARIR